MEPYGDFPITRHISAHEPASTTFLPSEEAAVETRRTGPAAALELPAGHPVGCKNSIVMLPEFRTR
jgi:hypothetical protein